MPTKITQLTALTSVDGTDILPVVDDVSGTPVTKKITVANLAASLNSLSTGALATIAQLNTTSSGLVTTSSPLAAVGTGKGWLKVGPIIIQWGYLTPSQQETAVSLPTPWPNGFLSGSASIGETFTDANAYTDNSLIWGIYPASNTTITIMSNLRISNATAVYKKMYWIAIGY